MGCSVIRSLCYKPAPSVNVDDEGEGRDMWIYFACMLDCSHRVSISTRMQYINVAAQNTQTLYPVEDVIHIIDCIEGIFPENVARTGNVSQII